MSNIWSYEVIFPPQKSATDTVRDVLQSVELRGYSPVNPVIQLLQGMQVGGYEEFAFESQDEAIEFLAANGGRLRRWKGAVDSHVFVPPFRQGSVAMGVDL